MEESLFRERKSKGEIKALKRLLYDIIEEMKPMTIRQIFYQAVSRDHIDKTEVEYKNICRLLTDMRKAHEIPWRWLADNTRWMRKPDTYNKLKDMLYESQMFYRRALWNDQEVYVEIWLEKDALSGVLYDVTWKWDVPLMVTRGYPSFTYIAQAAETIRETRKPTYLYYFGDNDPSGKDISRHVKESIDELVNPKGVINIPITFERIAVNKDQIISLDLPTRPTKQSDTRSKNFEGESVEVDAIHPDILRRMVNECIEQHIDYGLLEKTSMIENAERESLRKFIDGMYA